MALDHISLLSSHCAAVQVTVIMEAIVQVMYAQTQKADHHHHHCLLLQYVTCQMCIAQLCLVQLMISCTA